METKYTQKWLGMDVNPQVGWLTGTRCSASREYCSVLLNLEMKKEYLALFEKRLLIKSLEQLGIL